jgi:hypothetical protein
MLKKGIYYILLGALVLSLACCGGSSSGGGTSSVPQISLSWENTTHRRGDVVYGTLSWSDSDGDITTVYVEEYYASKRWDHSYPASKFSINGTSGSQRIYYVSNPSASPGIHVIKFYVRDAKGQQSNIVESNMTVQAKMDSGGTSFDEPLIKEIGR